MNRGHTWWLSASLLARRASALPAPPRAPSSSFSFSFSFSRSRFVGTASPSSRLALFDSAPPVEEEEEDADDAFGLTGLLAAASPSTDTASSVGDALRGARSNAMPPPPCGFFFATGAVECASVTVSSDIFRFFFAPLVASALSSLSSCLPLLPVDASMLIFNASRRELMVAAASFYGPVRRLLPSALGVVEADCSWWLLG